MSKTLFYAKKIVSLEKSGWSLNINLMFEGREFSMTEIPISINESDVTKLCPGARIDKGEYFTDIVPIENEYQFNSIFGYALTDEVPELLCDVYNGRYWYAKMIDTDGNETIVSSYLTEDFVSEMTEILHETDRFWMEIHTSSTFFNKDWSIDIENETTVFSNIQDGLYPIGASKAQTIIDSMIPFNIFSDKEDFKGVVMKSGNSLVLKVTDQCRRMGIDVGDEVSVTLSVNTPTDNTELAVFASLRWKPIGDPDGLCHRNGCDLELVKKFLDDFNIIGTVDSHKFGAMFNPFEREPFDHPNFFKDKDGNNMIVSQPYLNKDTLRLAEEWARKNGCTVEEHRDYSWHHPPDTTLLVYRKRVNPDWKIPTLRSKSQ